MDFDETAPTVRPATVHDVARTAGVSAQTVSRVLRNAPSIKATTRERVEAAVQELGYKPNHAARLLRTRRSDRIGALAHNLFDRGPGQLLRGAAREALKHGYTLSIAGLDGLDPISIKRALQQFEQEQVAGIMAVTLTDDLRQVLLDHRTDIPILIDPADSPGADSTASESGGRSAAMHLLSLGHRNFAMVTGPAGWPASVQRRKGFVDAVTEGGGRIDYEVAGDWTPTSGHGAAPSVIRSGATAAFALNDPMAIGLIRGLTELGRDVPRDVSVVGFDDVPEAEFLTPALTTIQPDFEREGAEALDALISLIQNQRRTLTPHSSGVLRVRESTAPRR
ncbi:LacI family DNA-binding transcriptional regulator [uncultured Microbacterium sp.]|uniref:LacI family DNA-binding transcriptional regulator n=1 Tax=uncultured Microbacterium sp. TaxID=191216 RepID=UPI0028EA700A|nr:LacI family DNA-binding transcriptional regulator [uncultured Microbacterium sp.]